ncbi:hypothetical protein BpHYR1_032461, partial [Brachionus plicatilis]
GFLLIEKNLNILPAFEIFGKIVKIESRDSLKIEIPKCARLKFFFSKTKSKKEKRAVVMSDSATPRGFYLNYVNILVLMI